MGVALNGRQVGKVPAALRGEEWVTGIDAQHQPQLLNLMTCRRGDGNCQRSHAHNAYVLYIHLCNNQSLCTCIIIYSHHSQSVDRQ